MYMYACFADPASGFCDEEKDHNDFNRNQSEGVFVILSIFLNFMKG